MAFEQSLWLATPVVFTLAVLIDTKALEISERSSIKAPLSGASDAATMIDDGV